MVTFHVVQMDYLSLRRYLLMALIYHLAIPKDWEQALESGEYAPASLQSEGFIHASVKEELIPSARIHFLEYDSLVILVMAEKKVKHLLKWEPAREGKLFPHIYGKISLERIENTYLMIRDKQGEWQWMKG